MKWVRTGLLGLGLAVGPMAGAQNATDRLGLYDPGPNLGLPSAIIEANERDCAALEDLVDATRIDAADRQDVSSVTVGSARIPLYYDPVVLEYAEQIRTTALDAEHRSSAAAVIETALELDASLAAVIEAFPPERIVVARSISYPDRDVNGFYDPYANQLVADFDPEHERPESGTAYITLHEAMHLLEYAIDDVRGDGAAQGMWRAFGGQSDGFVGHEGVAGSRADFYERHRDDDWDRGIMHCLDERTMANTMLRASTPSKYANVNAQELMAEQFARSTLFPEESRIHASEHFGYALNAIALDHVLLEGRRLAHERLAIENGILP